MAANRFGRWIAGGMLALTSVSGIAWSAAGDAPAVPASDAPAAAGKSAPIEYSPVVRDQTATNLYWGDTHLHTRNSADAFNHGNEGVTRDDAIRLAMGLSVTATNGMQIRLRRPYDFLVITDHAEYMGVFAKLKDRDEKLLANWSLAREWGELLNSGQHAKLGRVFVDAIMKNDPALRVPAALQQSIWEEAAKTADRCNQPAHSPPL